MDLGTESEYGKDMGVLWAAYNAGSFKLPDGMDQTQFAETIMAVVMQYDSVWIVEDRNDVYDDRGAVAVLLVKSDGHIIQPSIDYFKWATARNILRTTVAFFNWVRFSRDVSLCVFGSTPKTKNLYWKMRNFGIMVTYVGNGMFCLAGEKPCRQD